MRQSISELVGCLGYIPACAVSLNPELLHVAIKRSHALGEGFTAFRQPCDVGKVFLLSVHDPLVEFGKTLFEAGDSFAFALLVRFAPLGKVGFERLNCFAQPQVDLLGFLVQRDEAQAGIIGRRFVERHHAFKHVLDPFLKRILTVANQAVLEMARAADLKIGFKDLGAGGVSCVTSELADAGGFGCDVDLALVHQIADLPARVCACSETQERYGLAVPV